MTQAALETTYEALAQQLDKVPSDKRELYLAKLALLLSRDLADTARTLSRISDAAADLDL